MVTHTGSTPPAQLNSPPSPRRVCVMGAGLVGALASIYLAQRGWLVDVYDTRPDLRDPETAAQVKNSQRSINLALSVRGLSALQATGLGLEEQVMRWAIPMRGRMIHDLFGQQTDQAYDVFGQCINSVDRATLNVELVNAAERFDNVKFYFNHTLRSCDLDNRQAVFFDRTTGVEVVVETDWIVGADGAYSTCRRHLMRKTRMDYSQVYIKHGYCELTLPPAVTASGKHQHAMDPHHLHIWPRHTFMMIALPNPDYSFTCTLFMPFEKFGQLTTREELLTFFDCYFPDAVPLIGEDRLVTDYFRNPKGSLMSVKCHPYHYDDRLVIVGDAAHSMVPFYGQGMNCGFEDVEILFSILDQHGVTATRRPEEKGTTDNRLKSALACYTETRYPDAVAICDLAMYNYIEMRSSVVSWRYLIRKRLEDQLHRWFPHTIIPLYTMVSFTQTPYHLAVLHDARQTQWLKRGLWVSVMGLACLVGFGFRKNLGR
ncbi:kynurenine 3-monooxygenase, mitochondrial precursor [Dispira simplex]|nr:kynurenine 3-monooxygenase, mitochondrial precursor [Dispira simplex]